MWGLIAASAGMIAGYSPDRIEGGCGKLQAQHLAKDHKPRFARFHSWLAMEQA